MTFNWKLMGASVVGPAHKARGQQGQDRYGIRFHHGEWIMALADGAGSAPYGGEGAEIAVNASLDRLTSTAGPPEDRLWRAVLRAKATVLHHAKRRGAKIHDFASTLLIAILDPTGISCLQCGDGAIVAKRIQKEPILVTQPFHGEYINETCFLTDTRYYRHLQLTFFKGPLEGVALFSDGLEPIAVEYATRQAFSPFFEGIFTWAKQDGAGDDLLAAFLSGKRIEERSFDDKTLILGVNHEAEAMEHTRR